MRSRSVTALAVLIAFDALSWSAGAVPTLYYAFLHHDLPTVAGIRLLGGPFERLGLEVFIVAGLLLVVVSALKLLAAYWVWGARKDGAVFGLILLSVSIPFWYGFSLPLGPTEGLVELALMAVAWKKLS